MNHVDVPADGQTPDPDIRRDLLEPFIAATSAALVEMAGAEILVLAVDQRTTPPHLDELIALVEFTSGIEGAFVFHLSRKSAATLAQRILAGAVAVIDDLLVRDCMGEVANVIAGQAKALLADGPYHFTYRIPRTMTSAEEFKFPSHLQYFAMEWASEWGNFSIGLYHR